MKKITLILSVFSFLGGTLNAQQIPTQDLVVEYKFDNDNLMETSGSSYNAGGLTPSNTVSYVPGIEQSASAISPDGASLSNAGNITFSGNVKEYVVSFWFKANQGTGDFQLLELKDPGGTNGLTIDVLNSGSTLTVDQVSSGTSPSGSINYFASYLDNEWHHLVVKLVYWTGGGKYYLRTYLDNVEVMDQQYTVSLSNVWVFGGLNIYLPSQTIGNGISQDLKIDNFRFYEFPIELTDIAALYNEKNVSSCANIVNIPDANFKAALLQHGTGSIFTGTGVIDTDGDGEICETEAQTYTGMIALPGISVSDLTGIEAFTSLTGLDCPVNLLTNLDLSSNTALTYLSCRNNQLTSLDVSANTALTYLDCNGNNLTSLNVANGNNSNITVMKSENNSSLTCIQHDSGFDPTTNSDWTKDATASWSTNCGTAGIEDVESALNITIYPNPTHGDFSIEMGETIQSLTVQITDITGKVVYARSYTNSQKVNLNLNESPGVYFVTILADGMQSKYKLIKK